MQPLTVLSRDWKCELANLVKSAQKQIIISSPYLTDEGSAFILANLRRHIAAQLKLRVLTDLSPTNVYQGATDPTAIRTLWLAVPDFTLLHLPKLHAKVYIGDYHCAIVTSANLTGGGLGRNYEYGIRISDRRLVRNISDDIADYSDLGAAISARNLEDYCRIAVRLRSTYKKQQESIVKSVQREFNEQLLTAEDELIRLRLAGGAMHTVFAKTILYLLRRYGPLSTVQIHPKIESIHPDLCDNSVDRVIDGKRFGKKWKHAVRTAQQQLKRTGLVGLQKGRWVIVR
ncbi:MAG: phospholipase D family protein [Candidatus Hermodarchaeota archaeon]